MILAIRIEFIDVVANLSKAGPANWKKNKKKRVRRNP